MSRIANPRSGGHDVRRATRPTLNEYWISGEGINRQVLQTEICKYLGAEATSRPGEYQGVQGFKIKAMRPFTPDMLDDLRKASAEFQTENRAYMRRHDRGNASSDPPSPVPETEFKFGGLLLTPPPELAYTDSQAYDSQSNGMDYDQRSSTFPGRGSPAYTPSSQSYGGPVSNGPTYSSAGYNGPSSYATHPGVPSSAAPNSYGQDYAHAQRDVHARDVMRDAPQYGNPYQNQTPAGYHGNSGPQYGGAYNQRDDRAVDPRMGYDNYAGPSGGPRRQERQEPHFDSMQGMSGPGAGYGGAPPPGRGGAHDQGGYDPYSRGGMPDPRYGGRR